MIVPYDDKTNHQLKVRYVIVGIWNTIFGYLTFFVLDTILENVFIKRYSAYMCAMLLGQIIATINAFLFHKYVTFKSKIKGKKIIVEFFRFCLTYVFSFLLSLLALDVFFDRVALNKQNDKQFYIFFRFLILELS